MSARPRIAQADPAEKSPFLLHPFAGVAVYAATMIGSSYLLGAFQLSAPVRLILVLVPILGFAAFVASWVGMYRRADELQQKILLESLVGALLVCSFGALALYFTQKAGFLPPEKYPDLEYFGDLFSPCFFVGFVLGWWRAARRYQ